MENQILGRWFSDVSKCRKPSEKGESRFEVFRLISVDEYFEDGSHNSESKVRFILKNDFNYIEGLFDIFVAYKWKITGDVLLDKATNFKISVDTLTIDEEEADDDTKDEFKDVVKEAFQSNETTKYEIIQLTKDRAILIEEEADGTESSILRTKTKKKLGGFGSLDI